MTLSTDANLRDGDVLHSATRGVIILNRSDCGQLWVTGSEGLDYLHNQSTNDLKRLQPGQGCETVFITATAQVIDLVTLYRNHDGILMITSPQRRQRLSQTLSRFIGLLKGAQLTDRTEQKALLTLVGPGSHDLLATLGGLGDQGDSLHAHHEADIQGLRVQVAVGSGLDLPGYNLVVDAQHQGQLWDLLIGAGAQAAHAEVWNSLCLQQGRPQAEHELVDTYNPLEAGLWHAISLSKGCYIGQEVLAKQVTYERIRQTLWGIRLEAWVPPGMEIRLADQKIGMLTRSQVMGDDILGLAYIRTKANPHPGQRVEVGQQTSGQLEMRPYLRYPEQSAVSS